MVIRTVFNYLRVFKGVRLHRKCARTLLSTARLKYSSTPAFKYSSTHVETNAVCIYAQARNFSHSEVAAMIEGLIRHDTEMRVEKNFVDSHGQSEVAFAFCHLLSLVKLMPRLKRIKYERLYLPDKEMSGQFPNLTGVLTRPIRWVWPRVRKRGFLITRRFESEPSASSPKRSGGLSSRTCRRSCFVHDAAMCVNPSSASALIATADSATAAIFAGSRRGRNNDALLTGATSRQRLVEKPTSYVSAPIGGADAGLA